jgi:hypothetical protein
MLARDGGTVPALLWKKAVLILIETALPLVRSVDRRRTAAIVAYRWKHKSAKHTSTAEGG